MLIQAFFAVVVGRYYNLIQVVDMLWQPECFPAGVTHTGLKFTFVGKTANFNMGPGGIRHALQIDLVLPRALCRARPLIGHRPANIH